MHHRLARISEYAVFGFITLLLAYPLLHVCANYYGDFIQELFGTHPDPGLKDRLMHNHSLETAFKILKVLSALMLGWIGLCWYDLLVQRQRRITQWVIRVAAALRQSIENNFDFIRSQDKPVRVSLAIAAVILVVAISYFACTVPLHMDEWFTYDYFVARGFWKTMSFYPLPNNHIFYNLVAGSTVKLPIGVELGMRLPALLASCLTAWYFYKLCRQAFGHWLSLALCACLYSLWPVLMYSFEARGYAFVMLFTVLLLYSSQKLSSDYRSRRYRFLAMAATFLGLWSVPSFLYAALPVYMVLAAFVWRQGWKPTGLLVKDLLISGALTCCAYLIVLLFNDPQNLLSPNGGETRFHLSDAGAFQRIADHLKDLCLYFLGSPKALWLLPLLLLPGMWVLFRRKSLPAPYLYSTAVWLLFSPLWIVPVHRVLPFERSWIHLAMAGVIALGFLLQLLLNLLPSSTVVLRARRSMLPFGVIVAGWMLMLTHFPNKHRTVSRIDYEIEELCQRTLNARLRSISHIERTDAGSEFYPAAVLVCKAHGLDPARGIYVSILDSVAQGDLLIVEDSQLARMDSAAMTHYELQARFEEGISIFGRKR